MSATRLASLLVALLVTSSAGCSGANDSFAVAAVEYARSSDFPVARLIPGADANATVDMSWYFFVLKNRRQTILVDTGTPAFADGKKRKEWAISRAISPALALERAGTPANAVDKILISHRHWDHVDGLSLFPNASVWIQESERAAIEKQGAEKTRDALRAVDSAGRLHVFSCIHPLF